MSQASIFNNKKSFLLL